MTSLCSCPRGWITPDHVGAVRRCNHRLWTYTSDDAWVPTEELDDLSELLDVVHRELDQPWKRAAYDEVCGGMPDRDTVVQFVHSDTGLVALYRWAVQDAKRLNDVETRLRDLERSWWRKIFNARARRRP